MKKTLGILGLLIFVCVVTTIGSPKFLDPTNLGYLLQRTSLYGVISIGVAFVIITGGIDLSIGSVVALTGCLLAIFLNAGLGVPLSLLLVLLVSLAIGLAHGLLITGLRLQPFIVTLCGLLFYRGMARVVTNDQNQSVGSGYEALKYLVAGKPVSIPVPLLHWISDGGWSRYRVDPATGQRETLDFIAWVAIPMPVFILAIIAIAAIVFLNYSIYGRYLLALGRNQQAARYSGIRTDRMVVAAYVICAVLAGVTGILFALYIPSLQPGTHGGYYELYAIAAAVLGGCSLRGGEGGILGVIIAAALLRVLYNAIVLMGIDPQLDFAVIGMVILAGVIADELVKRYAAARRARTEAALAENPDPDAVRPPPGESPPDE